MQYSIIRLRNKEQSIALPQCVVLLHTRILISRSQIQTCVLIPHASLQRKKKRRKMRMWLELRSVGLYEGDLMVTFSWDFKGLDKMGLLCDVIMGWEGVSELCHVRLYVRHTIVRSYGSRMQQVEVDVLQQMKLCQMKRKQCLMRRDVWMCCVCYLNNDLSDYLHAQG